MIVVTAFGAAVLAASIGQLKKYAVIGLLVGSIAAVGASAAWTIATSHTGSTPTAGPATAGGGFGGSNLGGGTRPTGAAPTGTPGRHHHQLTAHRPGKKSSSIDLTLT